MGKTVYHPIRNNSLPNAERSPGKRSVWVSQSGKVATVIGEPGQKNPMQYLKATKAIIRIALTQRPGQKPILVIGGKWKHDSSVIQQAIHELFPQATTSENHGLLFIELHTRELTDPQPLGMLINKRINGSQQ